MNFNKLSLILLLLFTSLLGFSQSYKEYRGDIYFDRFNYEKAIGLYLQVMEKEPENNFVMRKLGESYKYLNNDTASIRWYQNLMETGKQENADLYNYASVLKNLGAYDKAGEVLKEYAGTSQLSNYLLSDKYAEELSKDTFRFKISLVEQSSEFSDFAPAYLNDKIIFASSRQGTGILKKEYERDGEAYLQLYVADTLLGGQLDSVMPFDNRLNTKYHEGPVCFCSADSTMYFTRNNYKVIKGMSSDGQVKLKIYTSKFSYNEWLKYFDNLMDSIGLNVGLDSEDWQRVKQFTHNSNEYSLGHPTLTKNGRYMYFVSDMPGGKGGTDLYVCVRTGVNDWSEPKNLRALNTEGNEMFPFIHESGVLFFASDGWPGLGGLDIFKAEPKGERFKAPVNMGAPLNSMDDDFGLIADKETKTGYFSSNRPGGKGGDDLYHVVFNKTINYILAGTVKEKYTGTIIPNANLSIKAMGEKKGTHTKSDENGFYTTEIDYTKLYDLNCYQGEYIQLREDFNPRNFTVKNDTIFYDIALDYYGIYGSVFIKGTNEKVPDVVLSCVPKGETDTIKVTSNAAGDFKVVLDGGTNYELIFNKPDFFMLRADYSTIGKPSGYVNVNEFITIAIEKIELNKTIEIPNIYYDLGKWNIRDDAAVELEKVVTFMLDNPTIIIELGSHTDARGSNASNQRLSQKRAESAVNWIVAQGIDASRIAAKGYGETKLKNRCADGVRCSEIEHQENRRTEIKITSF